MEALCSASDFARGIMAGDSTINRMHGRYLYGDFYDGRAELELS